MLRELGKLGEPVIGTAGWSSCLAGSQTLLQRCIMAMCAYVCVAQHMPSDRLTSSAASAIQQGRTHATASLGPSAVRRISTKYLQPTLASGLSQSARASESLTHSYLILPNPACPYVIKLAATMRHAPPDCNYCKLLIVNMPCQRRQCRMCNPCQ